MLQGMEGAAGSDGCLSGEAAAGPAAGRLELAVAAAGAVGLVVATTVAPSAARGAASQDWAPFVLVAGLILVGLVAEDDGLFAAAGRRLAAAGRRGDVLFLGASALVGVVTAVLNLDTAVAFLTPVLVHAARTRGAGAAPFVYGCLLLANAGSMLLPGSNLTNLIVLGHLHLSGGQYLARSWLASLGALVVTAAVVGVAERRSLATRGLVRAPVADPPAPARLGLVAVTAAAVLVLLLHAPALPVLGVGVAAVGAQVLRGTQRPGRAVRVLGLPVLAGLFGVAVALGTLGRVWSGPAGLLGHAGSWGDAVVGAGMSAAVNNLPAASLLAARTPPHPFALLVGLDLGPNLVVTGSLAWFLWLRSARAAGFRPSVARASRLGLVAVPLSMVVALAALAVVGG